MLTRLPPWQVQRHLAAGRILPCCFVFTVAVHLAEGGRIATLGLPSTPKTPPTLECESVRLASDQCAFVQTHCLNFEAGLLPYLRFYFCALAFAQPLAVLVLALWLAVLFATIGTAASDYFTPNLNTIARILGLSESVAGVTFLAFGNGSPDLFSTFASMKTNSGGLAIGELIGAAGFISSVVAGSMALVRPFKVPRYTFVRDVGYFAISSCFCLVFLSDGLLQLWECLVMVGLYVSYVAVIVVSHWSERKSQRQSARNSRSRSHFATAQDSDDFPALEPDHEDAETLANEQTSLLSGTQDPSLKDPARPGRSLFPDDPRRATLNGSTDHTQHHSEALNSELEPSNPIRPSLVGALEFRAISWSLVRSRSQSTISSNSFKSAHGSALDQHVNDLEAGTGVSSRMRGTRSLRAPSISGRNDASLGTPVIEQRKRACSTGIPTAYHTRDRFPDPEENSLIGPSDNFALLPRQTNVPSIILTDLGQEQNQPPRTGADEAEYAMENALYLDQTERSQDTQGRSTTDGLTVPVGMSGGDQQRRSPQVDFYALGRRSQSLPHERSGSESSLPNRLGTYQRRASFSEHTMTPDLALLRANPAQLPDQIGMPQPHDAVLEPFSRPRWWPKRVLPPPKIFFLTLFPTFVHWARKTLIERAFALFTAPSVFLLTITLPVVDLDGTHELALRAIYEEALFARQAQTQAIIEGNRSLPEPYRDNPAPDNQNSCNEQTGPPITEALSRAEDSGPQGWLAHYDEVRPSPSRTISRSWLLVIQIFTAPWLVALILWLNLGAVGSLLNLTIWLSCATTVALLGLMVAVIRIQRGKALLPRPVLCLMGFVVSVVWISTIAGEVVAVLKAIGLAFGISDALLGLTIFALGNSLGDLVANVTITRLGLPVMALSACFGGPLLNILLGVGLGGLYMTLRSHGDNVYAIHLGRSLFISGASLVATLMVLLIAVPLNGWKMDKRLGWSLIGLWLLCTTANIILSFGGFIGSPQGA